MKPRSRADYGACLEVLLSAIYHRVVAIGDTVVDGGAAGGLHTIPLGNLVGSNGRVYAYEAQHAAMGGLQRWVDHAGLAKVCVLRNVAIGADVGEVVFYQNEKSDALSSARRMNNNMSEWTATNVPITRIDDENISGRCSFVKLDLEGGERDAILGAQNLIARDRPVIAFENGLAWAAQRYGYDVFQFLQFFTDRKYEVYDFSGARVVESNLAAGEFVHEFVAFHEADEKRETIFKTIHEFHANFFDVQPAEDWKQVILRVHNPFSSGFWKN